MPSQEPAFAVPFGNGPVRAQLVPRGSSTRSLKLLSSRLFLDQLAAPGSPRMRRRRQPERQKAIGLWSKTTTLHVHDAIAVYNSFSSLHDVNVKIPNCTFYGGRIFLSPPKLECGAQEINSWKIRLHLTFSANWHKRDKVWRNANLFQKWRFGAVAVVDAKAPLTLEIVTCKLAATKEYRF